MFNATWSAGEAEESSFIRNIGSPRCEVWFGASLATSPTVLGCSFLDYKQETELAISCSRALGYSRLLDVILKV